MFGKKGAPRGDERSLKFWRWFEKNLARIERMSRDARAANGLTESGAVVLDELHAELQRYDRRLHPFGGIAEDGTFEMIFTADGDAAAFPAVFKLVKAAPALPGWRFQPLKPRMDVGGVVEIEGVRIDMGQTRYHLSEATSPPALLLLVEHDVTEHWQAWQFAGQMLAMSLLGEHDYATRLGEVGVVTRQRFQERWGHDGQPMAELALEIAPPPLH